MRIGDIDGKGIFYDENGEPIFQDGEEFVEEFKDDCAVSFKEKGKMYRLIFPLGDGIIYLSNKRFIFLREPVSPLRVVDQYGVGLHISADYIRKSRKIKQEEAREYFLFNLDEISKIKQTIINPGVFINTNKGTYWISVDHQIMDAIKKIKSLNLCEEL